MPFKQLTPDKLIDQLSCLQDARVLIVGDIMLDEYLIGDAARISPEAPVPVVLVEEERFMLGGAGNVARNISALGGRPYLISACGDGHNSERLRQALADSEVDYELLMLEGRPAATKTRLMARGQQLARIDREDASALGPGNTRALLDNLADHWNEASVLIISDYNKGIVSQEFMSGLEKLRASSKHEMTILVDPKTSNFPLYQNMDLLTPNTLETGEGAGLPVRNQAEIIAAGRAIFGKINCKQLLTTLGANGMALFNGPDDVLHIPTVARKVFDVSGAGDTVIGTLALSLAGGLPLLDACMVANFAAGNVVGEVGAAVTSREKVAEAINKHGSLPVERWI